MGNLFDMDIFTIYSFWLSYRLAQVFPILCRYYIPQSKLWIQWYGRLTSAVEGSDDPTTPASENYFFKLHLSKLSDVINLIENGLSSVGSRKERFTQHFTRARAHTGTALQINPNQRASRMYRRVSASMSERSRWETKKVRYSGIDSSLTERDNKEIIGGSERKEQKSGRMEHMMFAGKRGEFLCRNRSVWFVLFGPLK